MKNRHFAVLVILFATVVAANAQTSFQGKFQLTSQTHWGKALLPAGPYSFVMDSVRSHLVIHSDDGKVAAIVKGDLGDEGPGGSYIFVTGSGSEKQVRSINLPQLECSLVFKPLTKRERETLYARESQTIPVQVAKK